VAIPTREARRLVRGNVWRNLIAPIYSVASITTTATPKLVPRTRRRASLVGIATILPGLLRLIQQYLTLWIALVHFTANEVMYVLDWVHIRGYGRSLQCVNRLLLPAFSYNASSVGSGVIGH
jgi:hypothetical protein